MNSSLIKDSLVKTINKLDETQKMEEEFKTNANILITKQKLSKIASFTGYFDFMHNNFQTPVYYEGILYPSVTHAYHAARSSDETTRRAILNAETFQILGGIAIRIIDSSDWQERKLKVMEQLVRDKFRRSKELQEKLKSTDLRDLIMTYEEDNSKNTFWGMVKGKGQNQLGRILMKIRSDLSEDKIPSANPIEILHWINNSFSLVEDIQFIPEIKLTVNKDNKTIDHVVLKNKAIYKIGMIPQCDLVLQHPSISRLHAVILVDSSLGVILIDLRSKGGTKLDGDLLKDNIPYRLKTGKKINFALSTRDYTVEIDLSRVKKIYEREQMKLSNELSLANKLDDKSNDVINKSFGLVDKQNEFNNTIFVKNIPFNAAEDKLKEIFEDNFGKVIDLYWPKEHETGFKLNYAFIRFETCNSAKKAVEYGLIAYDNDDDDANEKENDFLEGNDNKKVFMLKIAYAINNQRYSNKKTNNKASYYNDKDKEDRKQRRSKERRHKRSRSRSRSRSLTHRSYKKYTKHYRAGNKAPLPLKSSSQSSSSSFSSSSSVLNSKDSNINNTKEKNKKRTKSMSSDSSSSFNESSHHSSNKDSQRDKAD